jgi:hypothetical protein
MDKWSDVTKLPAFQKLSPENRELAREQFFEQQVAPRVPKEELDDIRQAFDHDTDHTTSDKYVARLSEKPQGDVKPFVDRMSTGERLARGFAAGAESVGRGIQQAVAGVSSMLPTEKPSNAELQAYAPGQNQTDDQLRSQFQQASQGGVSDALRQREDQIRAQNAPLLQTGAGKVGNFLGQTAATAPAMLIPGAGSLGGATAIGAGMGAVQPVGSNDSRLQNTLYGAAGGALGQKAGQAVGYVGGKIASKLAPTAATAASTAAEGVTQDAAAALAKGYRLPPSMAKANPGVFEDFVESVAGKARSEQAFSIPNQANTNALTRKGLGLSPGDKVSLKEVQQTRSDAGDVYQDVRDVPGTMKPTQKYNADLDSIESTFKSYAKRFPSVFRNDEVRALVSDIRKPMTADEAVQLSIKLREDSTANYRAAQSTTKALGKAQKKAADAIDAMLEEKLNTPQTAGLYHAYRQARQVIARTYDVEKVLNDRTGDVDAVALAKLSKKRPLSGELADIADFGANFEGAARTPTAKGSRLGPSVSKAELGAAAVGALAGHPGGIHKAAMAATMAAAPTAARSFLLSDLYQNSLTRPAPGALSEAAKRIGTVAGANTLQDLQKQPQ